jgi:transposase
MHDAMKRHEVQLLKKAGLTNATIEEVTGVPERSIRRIGSEDPVESVNAEPVTLPRSRGVGRPSKADAFRAKLQAVLKKEPELPTVELLHRMEAEGYDGGKSALYELVARLRVATPAGPMVRFEGLPGEFSQNDFGQVDVSYKGGRSERIHFFAGRLKYSRWVFVEIVANENVESLVRALLRSFESFGGVPLVAVFDNPKTVVIRRLDRRIEWNTTFGQVALDYRFAPELCAPRRANQKGSVENLVGWVKGSFFKVRRFLDREDLESQLQEWLEEANTKRPSRATGVVPARRVEEERRRLRPLAIPAKDYALKFPVTVGPTGVVEHAGIRYAMPARAIGFPATLHLYENSVKIVARRYVVEHPRFPENGRTSYLPEQRAEHLASISGERGRLYFKRQQILDLGSDAEALLTEIVHLHPRTWPGEVEILFDLLQDFGDVPMRRALKRAVDQRLFGASFIARMLGRAG